MPADTGAAPLFRATARERRLYRAARLLAHVPDVLKIALSGEPPIVIDGQQLDPQLQLIRSAARGRALPGLVEPTVAAGRERYRRQTDVFRGPATRVERVRDIEMPTAAGRLRARHYTPFTSTSSPGGRRAAITVFFHGGGFVIGDLDTHDEPCRVLCRHAGIHVLSVAYRLAPEHPFPAALDDAVAAFEWTRANVESFGADPARVAVGGDSAGATLGAVVARVVDRARAPAAQLLIYPGTDFDSRRPSQDLFSDRFKLTRRDLIAFRDAYVGRTGVPFDDPRVSPLYAPSLAGLPPAVVAVAGFDPLRDDGLAYAERLAHAGVPVRTLRFSSLGHGFIHMTGVAPSARRAMRLIAREWAAVLDELNAAT